MGQNLECETDRSLKKCVPKKKEKNMKAENSKNFKRNSPQNLPVCVESKDETTFSDTYQNSDEKFKEKKKKFYTTYQNSKEKEQDSTRKFYGAYQSSRERFDALNPNDCSNQNKSRVDSLKKKAFKKKHC